MLANESSLLISTYIAKSNSYNNNNTGDYSKQAHDV